ncbi:hypothetical protein C7N43_26225 [Sphingobacteriales bacterium UPWRP_1]|nr:hypothetical protein B6N25_16155 [Sphingobacteriales bacterium TSM_CSS]PSJ74025.1 hypothetical protein C7N43_26225 [Sphingobacteriales bacterium UPWRP_1]
MLFAFVCKAVKVNRFYTGLCEKDRVNAGLGKNYPIPHIVAKEFESCKPCPMKTKITRKNHLAAKNDRLYFFTLQCVKNC